MVVDETLRLYPPAWITNRRAIQDNTICGYRIPADAIVSISPYVTHRDPGLWENPEGFDPERFSPNVLPDVPTTRTSRSEVDHANASAKASRLWKRRSCWPCWHNATSCISCPVGV
jgi:cytochrome P450